MKVMGLPPLEWAAWRGWSASLMSPVHAAPGLLLYFAMPTTHAKRLSCALAVPSLREGLEMSCGEGRSSFPPRHQRGEKGRSLGHAAKRSKGGGMGETRSGGHECSRVPQWPGPFSPRQPTYQPSLTPESPT
jgi:hypothetical protein